MPDWVIPVLLFIVIGVIYLIVGYVGNKIVDKGEDALSNASKRKKNATDCGKTENLADRYRRE